MSLPFLARTLFKRNTPLVKLLDTKDSSSGLTTYTFSGCNLGDLGSSLVSSSLDNTYGTHAHQRSSGRKMFAVIVHGTDTQTVFNISSVSIGGVNGSELADRGGATNAVNTGIYIWRSDQLTGITNTDIVVTWSEAISVCAIGVLEISNIGISSNSGTATGTGTGSTTLTPTVTAANQDLFTTFILGSTCLAGSEVLQLGNPLLGGMPMDILYDKVISGVAYSCSWSYSPQYHGLDTSIFSQALDYSSTNGFDAAALVLA